MAFRQLQMSYATESYTTENYVQNLSLITYLSAFAKNTLVTRQTIECGYYIQKMIFVWQNEVYNYNEFKTILKSRNRIIVSI